MAATATASVSSLILNAKASSIPSIAKPASLFFAIPSSSSLKLSCLRSSAPSPSSSRFVRRVAVSNEYDQEEESYDAPSYSPDLKIFVGNLPFSADSAQLAGLFETAGNVEMVEVIYDKVTGRSRGFGFVTMSTAQEVQNAVQQLNGYELDGRALRVNSGPAPPPREREFNRESAFGSRGSSRGGGGYGGGGGGRDDGGNRLYVGNLSWGVDNSALENLFSEQGNVVEARVVYDRDSGRSRGFGFVTFSSPDEMNSAIDSLNGAELDGRQIRVSVAEARQRRQF
ncbi:29 kDa ribonucleoprotein B, chloroplastic [Linum grandiflorum]